MLANTTMMTPYQKVSSATERPGTISCSVASNARTHTARVKLSAEPTANKMKLTATSAMDSGFAMPHVTPVTKRTKYVVKKTYSATAVTNARM